jgi:alkanesulfonate monooxygenase SsuD/methylene tetrahydromethanopterin reductase-like flavin-dependent oxidoreductase (luciferase family)
MIDAVKRIITPGVTTPRQLGANFAFAGFGCMPVGTADMVADVIEEWIEVADIDGFIMPCAYPFPAPTSPQPSRCRSLSGCECNAEKNDIERLH